jgi:hypothetical protein
MTTFGDIDDAFERMFPIQTMEEHKPAVCYHLAEPRSVQLRNRIGELKRSFVMDTLGDYSRLENDWGERSRIRNLTVELRGMLAATQKWEDEVNQAYAAHHGFAGAAACAGSAADVQRTDTPLVKREAACAGSAADDTERVKRAYTFVKRPKGYKDRRPSSKDRKKRTKDPSYYPKTPKDKKLANEEKAYYP